MPIPFFGNHPNFIERHYGCVDLSVYNNQLSPSTNSLKFIGTNYLSATPTETDLFTVPVGATYRSPRVIRSGINKVEETQRGLTRLKFDPDDFAGSNFNGEGAINFVKFEELDGAGLTINTSPWLVVPPPGFFGTGRRNLTLLGVAPDVSSPATYVGLPPSGVAVIKLPRYSDYMEISVTTSDLYLSLGAGHQELIISAGTTKTINESGASLIFLRGNGGNPAYQISFSIVNGIEA